MSDSEIPALSPEDTLNWHFAEKVANSEEFKTWILLQTKYRDKASDARLLRDEQERVRKARFWWRHWWCRLPNGAGESETDIFLAFEAADKSRFCLHVENKLSNSTFTLNQGRNYALRAKHMLSETKSAQLKCTDYETILVAPKNFQHANSDECRLFDRIIDHESIASHVPEFGTLDQ